MVTQPIKIHERAKREISSVSASTLNSPITLLEIEYKCPYCGQSEYNKTSKKSGKFSDWKAVRAHTSNCTENNKEYTFTKIHGPIVYVYNACLFNLRKVFIRSPIN